MSHAEFTLKNPNRVRALIAAFANNHAQFHVNGGWGYRLLGDVILQVDQLNPQLAARLTSFLSQWKRFGGERRELMRNQLRRIANNPKLSKDTYEVSSRSL